MENDKRKNGTRKKANKTAKKFGYVGMIGHGLDDQHPADQMPSNKVGPQNDR